jgi:hypothetical protein
MDLESLQGKYLRLREELQRVFDPAHAKRLREELERVEARLAQFAVPFADTLPLEYSPEQPTDG